MGKFTGTAINTSRKGIGATAAILKILSTRLV